MHVSRASGDRQVTLLAGTEANGLKLIEGIAPVVIIEVVVKGIPIPVVKGIVEVVIKVVPVVILIQRLVRVT